jgi:hypothetical protein
LNQQLRQPGWGELTKVWSPLSRIRYEASKKGKTFLYETSGTKHDKAELASGKVKHPLLHIVGRTGSIQLAFFG